METTNLRRKLTVAAVAAALATITGSAMAAQDQPPAPPAPAENAQPAPAPPPAPPAPAEDAQPAPAAARAVAGARVVGGGDGQPQVIRVAPAGVQVVMTEPQTFLGVSTGPIDEATAAQIDLPRGVGLVVAFVEEESPAKEAGIQRLDILHKLDDQLLVNTDQLTTLVRMRGEGETATITLLRRGEEQQVEVTFGQKELPVRRGFIGGGGGGFGFGGGGQWVPHLQEIPQEQQRFWEDHGRRFLDQHHRLEEQRQRAGEQARRALERVQAGGLLDAEHAQQIQQEINRAVEEMRRAVGEEFDAGRFMQQMDELRRDLDRRRIEIDLLRPGVVVPQGFDRSQTTIRDENMIGRLVNEDGETRLHIADREGNVLYEGPFPDDQTLAEMEPELRERIERFRRYARPAPADGAAPGADTPADPDPADDGREELPA